MLLPSPNLNVLYNAMSISNRCGPWYWFRVCADQPVKLLKDDAPLLRNAPAFRHGVPFPFTSTVLECPQPVDWPDPPMGVPRIDPPPLPSPPFQLPSTIENGSPERQNHLPDHCHPFSTPFRRRLLEWNSGSTTHAALKLCRIS